jgi:nucleotide-binding universal stress UspA family protein
VKILIAIDGSSGALESAKYYASLVNPNRFEVTVVTAVGLPKGSLTGSSGIAYSQFVAEALKNDERNYAAVVNLFANANAHLQHVVKHGHIGHCLVTAAEEADASLIVMGSKGNTRNERVALGSVSEYVATHASCSVFVVRSQPENPRERIKVTVAFDDSASSRALIKQLRELPWAQYADVQVVSVVPIHQIERMDSPTVTLENSESLLSEIRASTENAVAELNASGIKATGKVVESKHIGEQIAGLANLYKSDMIMMGAQGQTGVARSLLGSVTHYILRHATQSVWVVRAV